MSDTVGVVDDERDVPDPMGCGAAGAWAVLLVCVMAGVGMAVTLTWVAKGLEALWTR